MVSVFIFFALSLPYFCSNKQAVSSDLVFRQICQNLLPMARQTGKKPKKIFMNVADWMRGEGL